MARFATDQQAIRHVILHVLTPDESHAWGIIWREPHGPLACSPEAIESCARARESLHAHAHVGSLPENLRQLLFKYLASVDQQVNESAELCWRYEQNQGAVGLGSSGVYYASTAKAGLPTTIRTAFLPGFGTAAATRASQGHAEDPHARVAESHMRGRPHARGPSIVDRLRHRRAQAWTPDEQIYFLVFRPVLQFISGWQTWHSAHKPDISDLRPILPPLHNLDFGAWSKLRDKLGVGHAP